MSEGDEEVVTFDNVGLRYGTGKEVLSDISFTLWPGSFYFLTGASGAGKTSLLKLLYLAQRPSRGVIRMFGTDIITLPRGRLPNYRRRLGVVFQDFRLVPICRPTTISRCRCASRGCPRRSWPSRSPTCSNGSGSRTGPRHDLPRSRAGSSNGLPSLAR